MNKGGRGGHGGGVVHLNSNSTKVSVGEHGGNTGYGILRATQSALALVGREAESLPARRRCWAHATQV